MALPVLDGLMALNIALSMDAIPSAWACIVEMVLIISTSVFLTTTSGHGSGLCSHFQQASNAIKAPWLMGHWFSSAGAIICGTTGVLINNRLITHIPIDLMHSATIIVVLGCALLLMLALRPEVSISIRLRLSFLCLADFMPIS